ncbi:sugar-transfer associated ATP-grasp domain-containing protein [Bacillus sp. D386]|uniref:sugar-transfer associated ATP-grasp domain-containing protein n=1 Tax=Bacillus sp. D386 TaxID=2587155 RepID=UPI00111F94BF|nr:sugar-transfer associated ATP-grasp domain-containing protein [Bacillus sp. D386]
MKNLIKKIIQFINRDCFNFYLKIAYRRQLNQSLAKNIKKIDSKYKSDILEYWGKYNVKISTDWHNWYTSINGKMDVKYIPEDIFYTRILPYYNKLPFGKAYADKALYDYWFPNVNRPLTLAKNMSGINYDENYNPLTLEEVLTKCESKKKVIIKATIDSGSGKNIYLVRSESPANMREEISKVLQKFNGNFVIQEVLEQHDTLKMLNPSSVNTVRITTFLHQNKVSVLTSHLRIGNEDSIYDHYGIVCGIKDDGYLQEYAIKYKQGDKILTHPRGYRFSDIQIPSFEKIKDITKKEHMKFGHFRIISWDFAIGIDGEPVLIEVNLMYQGLNHHQQTIGPLFGELTDEVLSEVFLEDIK